MSATQPSRRRCRLAAALLALPLALAFPAAWAQVPVLLPQPMLASTIQAFPLLSGDAPALGRIRATLGRIDRAALDSQRACARSAKENKAPGSDWSRRISVTMAGPRLLGFIVSEDAFCGGAHPDETTYPLVFDLQNGRAVNWLAILPPALAGRQLTDQANDGLTVAGLHSLTLMRLLRNQGIGGDAVPADCKNAGISDDDESGMLVLWPDAATHRLMTVRYDLPHVVQACAEQRGLPVQVLRRQGVASWFVDALANAVPGTTGPENGKNR